ncbi:unnamed protein product [Microthlaspi erraticum]|uniref:BRO1 domain-containing protein n=1 Tax=Microthlaspi erraticum TaxID=1685480 RepID=A0A6D2I9Q2_9BRAS|nr:unnamed protein product [Microthlaspi erraticum]
MSFPMIKEKKQIGPVDLMLRVSCFERKVGAPNQTHRQFLLVYYKSLCLLESHFPDFCKTSFNIHMEKAVVLYNIGAISHAMGLSVDDNTIDGRREASMEFLAAATAFSYLRKNESLKVLVEECTVAGMLEVFMLAQAQECISLNFLEKAATSIDAVKAKLCSQVSLYYAEVLEALNAAPLSDSFEKSWSSYAELKAAIFHAEACLWHEVEDTNFRPARLSEAMSRLTRAVKSADKEHPILQEEASSLIERVTGFLASYDDRFKKNLCERKLPEIPSFSVIELLRELLEASSEKMFGKEFPDKHAMSFARYTEMVDDEIRRCASGEEEDLGKQLELLKKLEGLNEDEAFGGDHKAKKLRKTDTEAQRKSIIATAFAAENPTPSAASVTALGGGFAEKLSQIENVISAQMDVDKNDGAWFVKQVEKVKEEFRKAMEGKENSCEDVLDQLIAQMITLKTEQEMKVGASFKVFYEAMADFESKISGSDLSSLLSLVTEAGLKEIHRAISSLAALKRERKCYSQNSVKDMTLKALLDELVLAFHAEDFYSCQVILQRVKEMAVMAKLSQLA